VLALLVAVGAIITFALAGKAHDDYNVDSLVGAPRVELMPQDSPEWLERHYFDKSGIERKTEVSFRNGDVGVRIHRADGTLARDTVTNKDLVLVSSADFAADGKQVVKGFALRDDLSKAWETKQVGTDIETTMYWSNGKLFARQLRSADGKNFSATYYREDGSHWSEQSGVIEVLYGISVWRVRNETNYNDAGTAVTFSRVYNGADGTTLYSWFDETSGALRYQQWWRDYGWGRTLTDMDEGAPERVKLKGVVMHPAAGIAQETVIWANDDGPVEHIIDTLDDGSTREHTITQDSWQDVPDVLNDSDEPQPTDVSTLWIEQTTPTVHRMPAITSDQ
jgi:hypothetical protein